MASQFELARAAMEMERARARELEVKRREQIFALPRDVREAIERAEQQFGTPIDPVQFHQGWKDRKTLGSAGISIPQTWMAQMPATNPAFHPEVHKPVYKFDPTTTSTSTKTY